MTANISPTDVAQAAANVKIVLASWQHDQAVLVQIRTAVFMHEQQVSGEMEWDGLDAGARHLLALTDAGEAVGCARLIEDPQNGMACIGRMAVVKNWRGAGIGTKLLHAAITIYRQQGVQTIRLSAQLHAVDFYARAGFVVCSSVYLDADIAHVDMQLNLAAP